MLYHFSPINTYKHLTGIFIPSLLTQRYLYPILSSLKNGSCRIKSIFSFLTSKEEISINILVVGALGDIVSAVTKKAVEKGHNIKTLDTSRAHIDKLGEAKEKVTFLEGDIGSQ